MRTVLIILLLAALPFSWAQNSAPLPVPKVRLDDSNYPNIAFSENEMRRRSYEFSKKYVDAYAETYARLRGIPKGIPPTNDLIAKYQIRDEATAAERRPIEETLKEWLDGRVTRFEKMGGLETYRIIVKRMQTLKKDFADSDERFAKPLSRVQQFMGRLDNLKIKVDSLSKSESERKRIQIQMKIQSLETELSRSRYWVGFSWVMGVGLLGIFIWNIIMKRKI